jgi:hypothetical protein
MKIDIILSIGVIVVLIMFIAVDRAVVATIEPTFKTLEMQRVITANKLASAKIVYENLNHVRDLVQKNMIFPGQKDSVSHETIFFDFLTTCANDLKMKIVSCKPSLPAVHGKTTVYGYDIELEGDFFSLGELCSKFENSRRIVSVKTFSVDLKSDQGEETASQGTAPSGNKGITIKMHVNTYRIQKG